MSATRKGRPGRSGTTVAPGRGAPKLALLPGAGQEQASVKADLVSGVAVVTIIGPLTTASLPDCRLAVASVLRHRPRFLVFDLCRTCADDASLPALAQLRWYANHNGVTVLFAAMQPSLEALMRESGVASPHELHPSVDLALDAAVTASHRTPDRLGGAHR